MVTRLRDSAIFAIVTAIAAYVVTPNTTPIDRALPFVVVLLSVCAFAAVEDRQSCLSGQTRLSVLHLFITLLLLPPIFFVDEHTRLLAYGVIGAITFAFALALAPARLYVPLTICGVLLLRWMPFSEVIIWRELIVLAGAVLLVLVSRSVVLATAVALFTPIFPARVAFFPFLFGALIAVVPKMRLPAVVRVPIYGSAIALFAMWPWSGVIARAFPRFLLASPPAPGDQPVWVALARGESVSIDAPPHKRAIGITASGANAARFRAGTLMGTVDVIGRNGEVTHRDIRIGDIADFGFTRREHFFTSRNPLPRRPINDIHGYGQSAWLHTAGWLVLGSVDEIRSVRFSAARDLALGARLQIEAVDFE